MFKFFSPSGSHTILDVPYQTLWQYSPHGVVECRCGRQKSRFSANIGWMTAEVRSTIQLRRSTVQFTAQTATHQWILFITTSMDDHDEEKTELNCTSDKSEAEITRCVSKNVPSSTGYIAYRFNTHPLFFLQFLAHVISSDSEIGCRYNFLKYLAFTYFIMLLSEMTRFPRHCYSVAGALCKHGL